MTPSKHLSSILNTEAIWPWAGVMALFKVGVNFDFPAGFDRW